MNPLEMLQQRRDDLSAEWWDAGGAAFPSGVEHGKEPSEPGMTLRDHFAGQALQGMLARPGGMVIGATPDAFAAQAYSFADAMLIARGQPVKLS